MVFTNTPFILFYHVSLIDTSCAYVGAGSRDPAAPAPPQMCRNCQGMGLSFLSKHRGLSEKASKSVFKRLILERKMSVESQCRHCTERLSSAAGSSTWMTMTTAVAVYRTSTQAHRHADTDTHTHTRARKCVLARARVRHGPPAVLSWPPTQARPTQQCCCEGPN